MRAVQRLLPITAAAISCLGAFAASAQAIVVESSTVTTPSGQAHWIYDDDAATPAANTKTVTGSVSGFPGDVQLRCFYHSSADSWSSNDIGPAVTPAADGSFSVDVPTSDFPTQNCRLLANDASSSPDPQAGDGPLVAVTRLELTGDTGRNQTIGGKHLNFFARVVNTDAQIDVTGPAYGGAMWEFYADGPDRLLLSDTIFYDNPALYGSTYLDGSRSSIRIDGRNALEPYAAYRIFNDASRPGLPGIDLRSVTQDPTTGDFTIDVRYPLVACPGTVPTGSETDTNCAAFQNVGVDLDRVITLDHGGALSNVKDRWVSTDSNAHALDVVYQEDNNTNPGLRFRFPWVTSGYETAQPSNGDTRPSPPGDVSTLYAVSDVNTADGDPSAVRGSMTMDLKPNLIRFFNTAGFEVGYQRTIPSNGTVSIAQRFTAAITQSRVDALAGDAESAAQNALQLSLDGPATTGTPTATLTGKAIGDSTITSLQVAGAGVTPAADGGFTKDVALQPGVNTFTATVTDAGGRTRQVSKQITYTPPPAKLTLGKTSFKNGVFALKLSCPGLALTPCAGTVKVTAKVKTKVKVRKHGKTRTKTKTVTVTLASGKARVAQGKTSTLKVKLSRKGKATLAKARRLKARVTVAQKLDGKTATAGTRTLTIRAPKKKPAKAHQ